MLFCLFIRLFFVELSFYICYIEENGGDKMTINERVRLVRTSQNINLTLEKFGEKIGLKKGAISAIENERCTLTEQNIRAICREFNVDYMWLTTGEGEMFSETDDNLIETIDRIMIGENEFHKKILKFVAQMDDEDLMALEHLIDHANEFIQSDN